ncbi:MAG: GTPase [Gemmataceae bacterium]
MSDTRAACLTAPGRGAIATLAVRGPQAWLTVRALFHSKANLPDDPHVGQFYLGRFGTTLADEVVLAVRQREPVPWIEIHCHGGPEITRLLLESLTEQGVAVVNSTDFERASLGPLQALAREELARAATTRVAAILLDQYHGAFEHALRAILEALEQGDTPRGQAGLAELARFASLGRHLTEPWRVAVLGPPNVGKSSLINALAGYQRSVVSEVPGTTRDVVTTRLAVAGWPIELSDTAGLRDEAGGLEAQGIERARAEAARADLRLYLVDGSEAFPASLPAAGPPVHIILNKIDIAAPVTGGQPAFAHAVSARTGQGIAQLCDLLGNWLVPEAPPAGAPIPFTPALVDAIQACALGPPDDQIACLHAVLSGAGASQGAKPML